MTLPMVTVGGIALPFSQLMMENEHTRSMRASAFWLSPISSRRFLMCSPKVWGFSGYGLGFSALRVIGTPGGK